MKHFVIIVNLLISGFWYFVPYDLIAKENLFDKDTANPFQRNYLSLELAKNYPAIVSQNRFKGGKPTLFLGYRHNLSANWMVGIHVGFKSLFTVDDDERLPIFSINHESLYVIRLYHPCYALIGPKLLYLLPAKKGSLPLRRAEDYEVEIGAALSATLLYFLKDNIFVNLRMDRWRGTKTNKIHGLETALGLSYEL